MASVLSGSPIVQETFGHRRQSKHIVEFSIRQQPGVRRDLQAVEFKLERPVETHPESVLAGLTHRIPAFRRPWHGEDPLFMRLNDALLYMNWSFHPGNPGQHESDQMGASASENEADP